MTFRERAEKIFARLMERMMFRSLDDYSEGWAIDGIESQISKAVVEGRKELIDGWDETLAIKKAKAEAYEDAASIVEQEKLVPGETKVIFDPDCLSETAEQPQVALRKMFNSALDSATEAIRARKDEVVGK